MNLVAAQLASALANGGSASATSPTAFPFPPPSPLFLPTPQLGSFQQSPTAAAVAAAQHLQHLQHSLSSWMSHHSPVSPHPHHLFNMALGKGAAAFSLKDSQHQHQQQLFHGSDDNNNDVVTTSVAKSAGLEANAGADEQPFHHRSAFVSTKVAKMGDRQIGNGLKTHSSKMDRAEGEMDGRKSSSSSSSSTSPFSPTTSKSQQPPHLHNGLRSGKPLTLKKFLFERRHIHNSGESVLPLECAKFQLAFFLFSVRCTLQRKSTLYLIYSSSSSIILAVLINAILPA